LKQQKLERPKSKKNYLCNFRAPDKKHFDNWQNFKEFVKGEGLDICRVVDGLTSAFMSGATAKIVTPDKIININMANQFLYQVVKPRRVPYSLDCVKPEFRRTFSSILFEAYVLQKARMILNEFCFRDFLELKHDSFRRIIVRLKRKGKIIPHPIRTNPRFYILAERIKNYDTKKFLKNP
jgi:hypothetical protein